MCLRLLLRTLAVLRLAFEGTLGFEREGMATNPLKWSEMMLSVTRIKMSSRIEWKIPMYSQEQRVTLLRSAVAQQDSRVQAPDRFPVGPECF